MSISDEREFDPATFPSRRRTPTYDDFTVGQKIRHVRSRTLTETDNVIFTTAMCDWSPLQIDREAAREHGHTDVVVSSMLLLCTVVGLSVEDLSEDGGFFVGVQHCRFLQPVYPGDTVRASSEVTAMRPSKKRPGFGAVSWRTTGHNQHGEPVVELIRTNLMRMRKRTNPSNETERQEAS